jgi:hypothetical protein
VIHRPNSGTRPTGQKRRFSSIAGQLGRYRSGAAVELEQPFEAPGDKLDRAFQTDVIFRSGVPRQFRQLQQLAHVAEQRVGIILHDRPNSQTA